MQGIYTHISETNYVPREYNYSNGSIVSVVMDKVGVMATYSDPLFISLYMKCLHIQ